MAETFVRDDIRNYTARNIFGRFSKRSAIAGIAAIAVASAGIYAVYAWGWNMDAVTMVTVALCVAIGVLGLHEHHGLKSEKWLPLMVSDRAEPDELMLEPPCFEAAGKGKAHRETRAERRRAKLAQKARAAEDELMDTGFASELEYMQDETRGIR